MAKVVDALGARSAGRSSDSVDPSNPGSIAVVPVCSELWPVELLGEFHANGSEDHEIHGNSPDAG